MGVRLKERETGRDVEEVAILKAGEKRNQIWEKRGDRVNQRRVEP